MLTVIEMSLKSRLSVNIIFTLSEVWNIFHKYKKKAIGKDGFLFCKKSFKILRARKSKHNHKFPDQDHIHK